MVEHGKYFIVFFTIILTQSCLSPSNVQINKIDKPDDSKTKVFGIKAKGKIFYQFYQKYGFNDLEEQLIMILKPDKLDRFKQSLPISSKNLDRFNKIDMGKFILDKPINFKQEKTIQSDIRLEATEFNSGDTTSIFYKTGTYKFKITNGIETIYVYDNKSGLMYIESKRSENNH
jgi:hypothetical protein